jgi:hypothetical protein
VDVISTPSPPPQDYTPRIHMTELDFASITSNGLLCDERGMLGPAEFEAAMRKELRRFAQRQLADALSHELFTPAEFAQFAALKMLSLDAPPPLDAVWGGGGGGGLGGGGGGESPAHAAGSPAQQVQLVKLRREISGLRAGFEQEVRGLRDEVRRDMAAMRQEMRQGLDAIAALLAPRAAASAPLGHPGGQAGGAAMA